jgi:predicted DNA-binding protein
LRYRSQLQLHPADGVLSGSLSLFHFQFSMIDRFAGARKAAPVMIAAQLNIRLSSAQRAKLDKNARFVGKKPAEYVRELLDREEEYLTGEELYQRALKLARKLRKAGLVPQ